MTIIEYINSRIRIIDKELSELIDYDSIIKLRLKKEAYLIYKELLSYQIQTRLFMIATDKLDISKESKQMIDYGFKYSSYDSKWELKINEDSSIFMQSYSRDKTNPYEVGHLYLETNYKEIFELPGVITQMIKDEMIK